MPGTFSIDGIVSGLQTQDLISKLSALERRPITVLQTKIDRENARLKALQAIKTRLTSLQGTLGQLVQRGSINVKVATTDTSTTLPTILTATANADAINGSFKVTVSQLATPTKAVSTGPIGQVINKTATLANAGFRVIPITTNSQGQPATFTINGQTITVDATTTLDDGTANSVIAKINAAGANVTASLVADADGRADNRLQLVSSAGQTIQVGALGDTSNLLGVLNLGNATVEAYTAANLTSGAASAGAINTSITINGVTTNVNSNGTAVENAAAIALAINTNTANVVSATDNGDGTFTLTQKTLGSQQTINITTPGTGTGLTAGTTQNGTDRMRSTANLGVVDVSRDLANSRLVTAISGLDAQGNGKFSINGVEITYKSTDSITSIINRINSSTAGVTAYYDTAVDRVRLTAGQTGARAITLSDTTGNFLAAAGVLSAAQTLGQNATYTIDTVNGGQPLTSSTNTISGIVPGVTLDLKATSATPVTVTIAQNTQATVDLVKTFVERFNAMLESIEAQTKFDPKTKVASPLTADPTIGQIEKSLRSLVSAAAFGLTGTYRNLASIGVSTGAVGTAVGSTNRLVLDETKLNNALKDNPQAIESLFSSFVATLGTPSGPGNVVSVSGTPTKQHEDGTYYIKVLDAVGSVEVRFITSDGRQTFKSTGTLAVNTENTTLVPGLKLKVGATLAVGEDSVAMTVNTRGVAVRVNDATNNLLSATGVFANRESAIQSATQSLNKQIETMEARVKQREATLARKFTALETALSRLQIQSSALLTQISRLPAPPSSRSS